MSEDLNEGYMKIPLDHVEEKAFKFNADDPEHENKVAACRKELKELKDRYSFIKEYQEVWDLINW